MSKQSSVQAIVLGNVAFDVLCFPVDAVPRDTSITIQEYAVGPGGCGSNTAIGLAALGHNTALIGCIGDDQIGKFAQDTWEEFNVDTRYVKNIFNAKTGISIGLVDHEAQPRFIYHEGANKYLDVNSIPIIELSNEPVDVFHFAGFFLLSGILDLSLIDVLRSLKSKGTLISLDIQQTERLSDPSLLWSLLSYIDIFLCNRMEATQISGKSKNKDASNYLHDKGAKTVIIKLGENGCFVSDVGVQYQLEPPKVHVVDTTGAGDAFAAGLLSGILSGKNLQDACTQANSTGALMVSEIGAIEAWKKYKRTQ